MYRYGSTSELAGFESCDGFLTLGAEDESCRPQVDHIIPRVDIKGCECGPNSVANAAVISGKLNEANSNYCDTESKLAMFDEWTE